MYTDDLLKKHNLTDANVHLPAGNVGIFGRSGTGKSSLLYNSRYVSFFILADTGSIAHKLYTPSATFLTISPTGKHRLEVPGRPEEIVNASPIEAVRMYVSECTVKGRLWALDSWTALQEHEVAYFKATKQNSRGFISVPEHGQIVGRLRDLALYLAVSPGFTVFNTSPGGQGKDAEGKTVTYPKGCITGYPSLNGTESSKEPILARWSSVWGVFQGYKDIPRGLMVPSNDIRPEEVSRYAPLKDPYMVIVDNSDGKGIMTTFDMANKDNHGRCFVDEILVEISAKWPKQRPAEPRAEAAAPQQQSPANGKHEATQPQESAKEKAGARR